jgi:hypothetical protein
MTVGLSPRRRLGRCAVAAVAALGASAPLLGSAQRLLPDATAAVRARLDLSLPQSIRFELEKPDPWRPEPNDAYHKYFVNLPLRLWPGTPLRLFGGGTLKWPGQPDAASSFVLGLKWKF